MKSEDFCTWLRGYLDALNYGDVAPLSSEQVKLISEKLNRTLKIDTQQTIAVNQEWWPPKTEPFDPNNPTHFIHNKLNNFFVDNSTMPKTYEEPERYAIRVKIK